MWGKKSMKGSSCRAYRKGQPFWHIDYGRDCGLLPSRTVRHKLVQFEATKFLVVCYRGNSKLLQLLNKKTNVSKPKKRNKVTVRMPRIHENKIIHKSKTLILNVF